MGWWCREETVETDAFVVGDQALLPVISHSGSWEISQLSHMNKPNSESEK